MAYYLPYDTNSVSDDSIDCRERWSSDLYNVWSTYESFSTESSESSSPPTAPSLASSSFSVDSIGVNLHDTCRSLLVSSATSDWSTDLASSPVTPHSNRRWCSTTPLKTSARPYTVPYIFASSPAEHQLPQHDGLWGARSWHIPILPLAYADPSAPCLIGNELQHTEPVQPFTYDASDPALSRHIFSDSTYSPSCRTPFNHRLGWSTPTTVAPGEIVQSLPQSSPLAHIQRSSPFDGSSFATLSPGLESSPLPMLSPPIVPSQPTLEIAENSTEPECYDIKPVFTRIPHDRNARRQSNRRVLKSMASKPPRIIKNIVCHDVIPENTFTCSFPGCIDTATMKQRAFKRQEHKKRHETSVHGKLNYYCWVPQCNVKINRSDNMNTHYNTHSKCNSTQRNRYVATLDKTSKYSNPNWRGDITEDGYPLIPEVSTLPCWVQGCKKLYHLHDKLKAHLLQQHGKKSPDQDIPYVATLDEKNELFDPKWKGSVTKDGLPIR